MLLVATVLTACGIETNRQSYTLSSRLPSELQQYLPLAVLKPPIAIESFPNAPEKVATVLTACGIETKGHLYSNEKYP